MVYRVYVEKRPGLTAEADALLGDIRTLLRIESVKELHLLNRYDVENITPELFDYSVKTILSEPQLDIVTNELPQGGVVFAVEYLPGQFDQRADSAAQCIQILSQGERPLVKSARVYQLIGDLAADEVAAIKKYLINPVESREASLEPFETLAMTYDIPDHVATLDGFRELDEDALVNMVSEYGLAMDVDDLRFTRDYFREEGRDPTMTELRVIDTYWSDHCRHTTFLTTIDGVEFASPILQQTWEDYLATRKRIGRTKPINLMDIGTIVAKYLKKQGKMPKLDESEEINACTVKIKVDTDDGDRALRRRGHLCGRRHPRPPVRPILCLLRHASYRRGGPPDAHRPDHGGQAAPADHRHQGGGGVQLLRQPDRPGHRPGGRALPSRLCRQAHGDRRGHCGGSCGECPP